MFYLLFYKLERISFGISSDCEFITASCIAWAEFRDWELTTVLIATAFFVSDFNQLMLSVISITLMRVIAERFLNGNLKFNLTWNGEFWLFFISILLYSWWRIVLAWISSFLLSFRCPYLFVCGFDLSVWYQVLFDMIYLHKTCFCILCSFLFGLLFLYLLVLNIF